MKIAELLRTIADIIDDEKNSKPAELITIQNMSPVEEKSSSDLDQIVKLAGVAKATTEPDIHIFPLSSAFPAGDDFHYSKNPADMRSDSVSLYPGYSARPKE